MPYNLPEGFPNNLSDDELEKVVESLVAALREQYGDNVGGWLPELQLALMTVAISDQGRRQLVSGSRVAVLSLVVAAAALIVAMARSPRRSSSQPSLCVCTDHSRTNLEMYGRRTGAVRMPRSDARGRELDACVEPRPQLAQMGTRLRGRGLGVPPAIEGGQVLGVERCDEGSGGCHPVATSLRRPHVRRDRAATTSEPQM